jgi:tetratricopeptide (TPR) repeat protein
MRLSSALLAVRVASPSSRAEWRRCVPEALPGRGRRGRTGFGEAARLAPGTTVRLGSQASGARIARAEGAYRRAAALNPSDAVTKHELARLYLAHLDRFGARGAGEATRLLREALEQNPYYAEIRNDLGVALLRAGNRPAAMEAFRRAAEGRRPFVDPLINLAALALEDGDRASAESWTRRALERNRDSARALAMASGLGIVAPKSGASRGIE